MKYIWIQILCLWFAVIGAGIRDTKDIDRLQNQVKLQQQRIEALENNYLSVHLNHARLDKNVAVLLGRDYIERSLTPWQVTALVVRGE